MTEEIIDLMLMVKTYPQPSKKYQNLVCSAGITEDGRWMRLYPVKFELFLGDDSIHKYDILKLMVEKNRSDHRKESFKVIKILERFPQEEEPDWAERERWLNKVGLDSSLEDLDIRYHKDFTSLGIIKPKEIRDLISEKPVSEEDLQISKEIQMTLFNERIRSVDEIMNKFQYIFSCDRECTHEIMCEDWELLEAYRKYWEIYGDPSTVWEKLHNRFFSWLSKRDLYFIMGTHSRFPTWMIIGLHYPPGIIARSNGSLDDFGQCLEK